MSSSSPGVRYPFLAWISSSLGILWGTIFPYDWTLLGLWTFRSGLVSWKTSTIAVKLTILILLCTFFKASMLKLLPVFRSSKGSCLSIFSIDGVGIDLKESLSANSLVPWRFFVGYSVADCISAVWKGDWFKLRFNLFVSEDYDPEYATVWRYF